MRNILLIGYYGKGEYCDDYLESAIRHNIKECAGEDVVFYRDVPQDYSIIDLAILGGGTILGLPFPKLASLLKKNNCPFYIFGTGGRDVKKDEGLSFLWGRANDIVLRGDVSRRKCLNAGLDIEKVSGYGDPIFLYDKSSFIKRYDVGMVNRPVNSETMGKIQDFLVKAGRKISSFVFCKGQGDTGEHLSPRGAYDAICKCSFWTGNRLHPACIALLNGIPVIPVDIEFNKVEDVCSVIGYSYWIKDSEFDKYEQMYCELREKGIPNKTMENINNIRMFLKKKIREIVSAMK